MSDQTLRPPWNLKFSISSFFNSVFHFWCYKVWDISLHSFELSQLCILLTPCPHPVYLLGDRVGKKKNMSAMYKHCSATAKTFMCHQHAFNHKSETQHCTCCWEETPPSQPKAVQKWNLRVIMTQNHALFSTSTHQPIQAQQHKQVCKMSWCSECKASTSAHLNRCVAYHMVSKILNMFMPKQWFVCSASATINLVMFPASYQKCETLRAGTLFTVPSSYKVTEGKGTCARWCRRNRTFG